MGLNILCATALYIFKLIFFYQYLTSKFVFSRVQSICIPPTHTNFSNWMFGCLKCRAAQWKLVRTTHSLFINGDSSRLEKLPKGWQRKFVCAKIFEVLSCLNGLDQDVETLKEWLPHLHYMLSKFQPPSPNRSGLGKFQIFWWRPICFATLYIAITKNKKG